MCLIAYKPNDKAKFTLDDFKASYSRNNDGTGIMFVDGGRVQVERAVGSLDQQLKVFASHQDKDSWVLHQRFATAGAKDVANCHPFKVLDKDEDGVDLFMVHNGTLNSVVDLTEKGFSDTWHFVENVMKPMLKRDYELLNMESFQIMLHATIGAGNKLLFLSSDNEVLIFNEEKGSWREGCWVSNTYSLARPTTAATYQGRNTGSGVNSYGYGNEGYSYGGKRFSDIVAQAVPQNYVDEAASGIPDTTTITPRKAPILVKSDVAPVPSPQSYIDRVKAEEAQVNKFISEVPTLTKTQLVERFRELNRLQVTSLCKLAPEVASMAISAINLNNAA